MTVNDSTQLDDTHRPRDALNSAKKIKLLDFQHENRVFSPKTAKNLEAP